MTNVAEIRGMSEEAFNSAYQSQPNVLGGTPAGFIATLFSRAIAQDGGGSLTVGNTDLVPTGWIITETYLPGSVDFTAQHIITFSAADGGSGGIVASIAVQPGKHSVVHCVYAPNLADEEADFGFQIWVNGVLIASGPALDTYVPSSGRFSIGPSVNAPSPIGHGGAFCGFGYVPLTADMVFDDIAAAITSNAREVQKRGRITDGGLLPSVPKYTHMYDPSLDINNGVPTVLVNHGTAANGNLTVTTDMTGLVATANALDWMDVNVLVVDDGGGEGLARMASVETVSTPKSLFAQAQDKTNAVVARMLAYRERAATRAASRTMSRKR